MAVHLAVEGDPDKYWPKVYCGSPGSVRFTRKKREADCRDCLSMASIVESKELQASLAHADEVKRLERRVIDAAAALTTSIRASRTIYGAADEFVYQYFEAEQGAYLAVLLEATDSLIAARAAASTKEE